MHNLVHLAQSSSPSPVHICRTKRADVSYIWALPVWGGRGGLDTRPDGLGHLFRNKMVKMVKNGKNGKKW